MSSNELTERDKRFVKLFHEAMAERTKANEEASKVRADINRRNAYQPYLKIQKLVPAMIDAAYQNFPDWQFAKVFSVNDNKEEIIGWQINKKCISYANPNGYSNGLDLSDSISDTKYTFLASNGAIFTYNDSCDIMLRSFDYYPVLDNNFSETVSDQAVECLELLKIAAQNIFRMSCEYIEEITATATQN